MTRSISTSPSQPDLKQLAAEHKLPGRYEGEDTRRQLQAIADARPTVGQAVAELKKRKGVKITEDKDGELQMTTAVGDLRAMQTIAEMTGEARRLETLRGDRNLSLRNLIEVKDRAGRRQRVNAQNERALARSGLISAAAPPRSCKIRYVEGRDGEMFRDYGDGRLEATGKVYVGRFPDALQLKKQQRFEALRARRKEILEMMRTA